MNKIGKMEESNNEVLELQMEGQEQPKKWSELSKKDLEELRQATLERFEEYINSDREKVKSIITQILTKCGLDTKDVNNRIKVSQIINNEKQRRERENEASIKHRNRFSDTKRKAIKDFIIKSGLHTAYLKADVAGFYSIKSNIILIVLNELKIKDCDNKNRHIAQRLIVSATFKDWSGKEEEVLGKLLSDNIDTAVWSDKEITTQTREEIMNEFKKQFPTNEHNNYDIADKINSIVSYLKRTRQKPTEMGQIKSVQQAISQITEKQIRLDKVTDSYNDLFLQSKDSVVVNNVDKATLDAIQQISNINGLIDDFSKQQ